jgi:hypothetical protein
VFDKLIGQKQTMKGYRPINRFGFNALKVEIKPEAALSEDFQSTLVTMGKTAMLY